jgi:predicted hotdog family 3-hydroxylacyl-ACP dehydratase
MSHLDRREILALIPHAGAMCLLDEVLDWDGAKIRCLSHRYAAADNPLRRPDGALGTACGRLTAPAAAAPIPGYLVSLRDVHLAAANLDIPGPLTIIATRLLGDATGAAYHFSVSDAQAQLLSGRATVLFGAVP